MNSSLHNSKSHFPLYHFSSVQFSRSVVYDSSRPTPWTAASPTHGVNPNSSPLSRWCHLTISSSVIPFSSCLQSFPTSESFQMSHLYTSGDQNIGVSASASVLPMNTQDWFPLGWTVSCLPNTEILMESLSEFSRLLRHLMKRTI